MRTVEIYFDRMVTLCERVRWPVFAGLLVIWLNYVITTIIFLVARSYLWLMLVFHAPSPIIDQARLFATRSWESSFVTPWDWACAQYRFVRLQDRVDVVVSHYKEDLNWLRPFLKKIDHLYLYCKHQESCLVGLPENLEGAKLVVTYLPNEGREANSYLAHIIKHYDDIPRRTVFTLASMKHNWGRYISFLLAFTEFGQPTRHNVNAESLDGIRFFHFNTKTVVALSLGDGYRNARDNVIKLADRQPLNDWMMYRFGRDLLVNSYRCGEGQHGAIFSTDGQRIRRFPKSLYRLLLDDNSGADSMEVGYYMERLWRFMYA